MSSICFETSVHTSTSLIEGGYIKSGKSSLYLFWRHKFKPSSLKQRREMFSDLRQLVVGCTWEPFILQPEGAQRVEIFFINLAKYHMNFQHHAVTELQWLPAWVYTDWEKIIVSGSRDLYFTRIFIKLIRTHPVHLFHCWEVITIGSYVA